jgi:hypothetical protein
MTLILEVPPEREAVFQAEAQACGAWGSADTDSRPIGEIILDNMKDVPCEAGLPMPKGGASQHDHYLYGHPNLNYDRRIHGYGALDRADQYR